MIQWIDVSGFKSLMDFRLELQPGLNVLVGPNGSGKTNILGFFEFLSWLASHPVPEAVSKMGGAGAVFTRLEEAGIQSELSFAIGGAGELPLRRVKKKIERIHVIYRYECSIHLGGDGTKIYFRRQRLSMSIYNPSGMLPEAKHNLQPPWQVDIEVTVGPDQVVRHDKFKRDKRALDKIVGDVFLEKMMFQYYADVSSYTLFDLAGRFFEPAGKISRDIAGGRIYNIIPSRVKLAEDMARSPVIDHDGAGLAATLFSIENKLERSSIGFIFRPILEAPRQAISMEALKQLFKLVNGAIIDIKVETVALENQIKVTALVESRNGQTHIPLSLLSDGTVKWLSLVTAIATNESIFSIEEPENFLHPLMQREIVELLRRSCIGNSERFAIVTTHSESLLNALDPTEVVVVSLRQARTVTARSENIELLRSEINRTGFGLGYYYVTGALED